MKFNNVVISGMANSIPEKVITSAEIEDHLLPVYRKLKLPAGRLELMTGIKERRYWDPGTRPSDLCTTTANSLFENSNIKPSDIGIVIHASICRDFLEPATASVIHHNLKLNDSCILFDLSNVINKTSKSFSSRSHISHLKLGFEVSKK